MTAFELIGRDTELKGIARAFLDPEVRAVVLRGPAGAGKTALAEAVLAAQDAAGVLIGRGKYAEGDAQPAFEPLMSCLAGLAEQALDQLYEPEPGLASLRDVLGEGVQVLAAAGFKLKGLASPIALDAAPGAPVRLAHASLRLLAWLRGFGLPLLLFVDDWHRAPAEPRRLIHALQTSGEGSLRLLLCERDEAAGRAPPEGARLFLIGGLSQEARLQLLARKLGPERAEVLTRRLGEDGAALPFDVLELAQAAEGEAWSPGLGLDDAARRCKARWLALTPDARRLGAAAAMWGEAAPGPELIVVLGLSMEGGAAARGELSRAGFIWNRDALIGFHHDRLRAGLLEAAGLEFRRDLAKEVSEAFLTLRPQAWDELQAGALHLRLFCGIEDADPALWRERFVEGAARARSSADAAGATAFAEAAYALHRRAPASSPRLRRRLLREAVFAAADRGRAETVAERARELTELAVAPEQVAPEHVAEDYALAVNALRSTGDLDECWRMAREGLARLGLRAPSGAKPRLLGLELMLWRLRRLGSRAQPQAPNGNGDAAERLLTAAGYAAYERGPAVAAQLAVRLSGQARAGGMPYWTSVDAYLSAIAGDLPAAARLGQEADRASSRQGPGRAATLYRAALYGWGWVRPASELAERGEEIQALALAEGDLATAAMAARLRAVMIWRACRSLDQAAEAISRLERDLSWLGDAGALAIARLYGKGFAWLRNPSANACPSEPELRANPSFALELRSLEGDWPANARWSRTLYRGRDSRVLSAITVRFHAALCAFKVGERANRADLKLVHQAAGLNSYDHAGKQLLLRAVAAETSADPATLDRYAAALDAAERGGSRFEAGLIAELATQAGHRAGRSSFADDCSARAQAIWSEWGAQGRVKARIQEAKAVAPIDLRLSEAQARSEIAERAGRAKSRFLADVAHELRTPLQGLQGLLDLAAESGQPLDVSAFREVFGSLKTVVDDLTDYGALSSGEAPLHPTPARLDEIVRSECTVASGQGGLELLSLEIDPALPAWVSIDSARVRQVLRNLLSNAGKYAGGAAVRVRLRPDQEPGFAELVVEDEGPGLGPNPALVFEPFERAGREGDGRGLGLGLALARRMAERMQGGLTAHAKAQGALFRFRFAAPPATEPAAVDPARTARLRVLLAEDVALNRRAVAALLRNDGHTVVEACDGLEALMLAAEGRFDLLLLDLRMPGLSGLEVLERLRDTDTGLQARSTALLMTASSDPELGARAAELGAAGVLRKPATAEALRAAIAATSPPNTPSLELELKKLREEAGEEIRRAVAVLNASGIPPTAAEAHWLSGLAAQFGFDDLADAAEALERGLLAGDAAWARVAFQTLADRAR